MRGIARIYYQNCAKANQAHIKSRAIMTGTPEPVATQMQLYTG